MTERRTIPYRILKKDGTKEEGEFDPSGGGQISVSRKDAERLFFWSKPGEDDGEWVEQGAYAAGPVLDDTPEAYCFCQACRTKRLLANDGEVPQQEVDAAGRRYIRVLTNSDATATPTEQPAVDVLMKALQDQTEAMEEKDLRFRRPETGPYAKQLRASTILDEAAAVVRGPREAAYGHPKINMERTAHLLAGYMAACDVGDAEPNDLLDVFAVNLLQKLSRLMASPLHRDSIVDIAGWAAAYARAAGVDA